METISTISLYGYYIHYNEFEKTWNVFSREEQSQYLNDKSKMESLITFSSFEELAKMINESLKNENND
jgi:hypothetical protein